MLRYSSYLQVHTERQVSSGHRLQHHGQRAEQRDGDDHLTQDTQQDATAHKI
jgi:hypothetical protein